MVGVTNGSNRRPAISMNQPNFSRLKFKRYIVTLFSHQLNPATGTPSNLRSLTGAHLHIMYQSALRNILEKETIADADFRILTRHQHIPHIQLTGSDDITLLSIRIGQEGDPRAAIRIVFNTNDFRRDTVFPPLKINDPILLSMSTASPFGGDTAIIIPPTFSRKGDKKAFLRGRFSDLIETGNGHRPYTG